jgi:hypothetical protein
MPLGGDSRIREDLPNASASRPVALPIADSFARLTLSWPRSSMYSWSGWYLAVLPGAYSVGLLLVMAWFVRGLLRSPRRPERAALGAAQAEAV